LSGKFTVLHIIKNYRGTPPHNLKPLNDVEKRGGAGCLRGKEAKGVDCEYTLPSQPNRVISLVEG
jgi:hypothetical protein